MEKIASNEQITDLSLAGLEQVFVHNEQIANNEQNEHAANVHEQIHEQNELSVESHELVTMAEASRRLRMPYPTLRRQVLCGKISSVHAPDGKLMVKLMANEQSVNIKKQPSNKTEQNRLQSEHSMTVQSLLQQIETERNYSKSLNEKLEAASHRNGFLTAERDGLEAERDSYKEQIKLLTDSQHKSRPLVRFWSWFTKSGAVTK